MSPASRTGAPEAAISCVLRSTISLEISPYFTANVPPKPQQTSERGISAMVNPATVRSNFRGCSWILSSRKPEQES